MVCAESGCFVRVAGLQVGDVVLNKCVSPLLNVRLTAQMPYVNSVGNYPNHIQQ